MPAPESSAPSSSGASNVPGGKLFRCSLCMAKFNHSIGLNSHLGEAHRKEMAYWCKDCAVSFNSIDRLITHMENDCSGINHFNFSCGFSGCQYSHKEPNEFAQHMKLIHRGKSLIPCLYCQTLFTIPYCLIQHIQNSCDKKPETMNGGGGGAAENVAGPSGANNNGYVLPPSATNNNIIKNKEEIARQFEQKDLNEKAKQSSNYMIELKRKIVANNKSKKPLFSESDSDPDDPTWKTEKAMPLRKRKRLQTRLSSSSGSSSSETENEKEKLRSKVKSKKTASSPDSSSSSKEDTTPLKEASSNEKTPELKTKEASPKDKVINSTTNIINNGIKTNMKEKIVELKSIEKEEYFKSWTDWSDALNQLKTNTCYENDKLEHFFKCMFKCEFTTNDVSLFKEHLQTEHVDENQLFCVYCLKKFVNSHQLISHMTTVHYNLIYQCSGCFYRASSRPHLRIHNDCFHSSKATILTCLSISSLDKNGASSNVDESSASSKETELLHKEYKCCIGDCIYTTFNTMEFMKHHAQEHENILQYPCCYCKESKKTMSMLLLHLRVHGINDFQCFHCAFGSDRSNGIIEHCCINHANKAVQIFARFKEVVNPTTGELENHESDSDSNESSMQDADLSADTQILKTLPERVLNHDSNFKCKISNCDLLMEDLEVYRNHLQKSHHHDGNSEYLCPHCPVVSKSPSEAVNHLRTHGPNLYACGNSGCGFYHWEKDLLVEHKCSNPSLKINVLRVRKLNSKKKTGLDDILSLMTNDSLTNSKDIPEDALNSSINDKNKSSPTSSPNLMEKDSSSETVNDISSTSKETGLKTPTKSPVKTPITSPLKTPITSPLKTLNNSPSKTEISSPLPIKMEREDEKESTIKIVSVNSLSGEFVEDDFDKTAQDLNRDKSDSISELSLDEGDQLLLDSDEFSDGTSKIDQSPETSPIKDKPKTATNKEIAKVSSIKETTEKSSSKLSTPKKSKLKKVVATKEIVTRSSSETSSSQVRRSSRIAVENNSVDEDEEKPSTSSARIMSAPPIEVKKEPIEKEVTTPQKYICVFCNQTLGFRSSLKEHIYRELNTFNFQCNLCDFRSLRESQIQKHFEIDHSSISREKKSFTKIINEDIDEFILDYSKSQEESNDVNKLRPKMVMDRKQRDPNTPLQCPMCLTYKAPNGIGLENHVKKHLNYKPYSCSICVRRFTNLKAFNTHHKTVHKKLKIDFNFKPIAKIEEWVKMIISQNGKDNLKDEQEPSKNLEEEQVVVETEKSKIKLGPFARKSTGGRAVAGPSGKRYVAGPSRKRASSEPQGFSYYKKRPILTNLNTTYLLVEKARVPICYYKDIIKFNLTFSLEDFRVAGLRELRC